MNTETQTQRQSLPPLPNKIKETKFDFGKLARAWESSPAHTSLEATNGKVGGESDAFKVRPMDEEYKPENMRPARRPPERDPIPYDRPTRPQEGRSRQRVQEDTFPDLEPVIRAVDSLPEGPNRSRAKALVTEAVIHTKGLLEALTKLHKELK